MEAAVVTSGKLPVARAMSPGDIGVGGWGCEDGEQD